MNARPVTLIIACGALAREIAALRRANGWSAFEVRCLPAELHNRPERIAPAVREAIREHRAHYARIFVAYADCGTRGALDAVLAEEGFERLPGPRPSRQMYQLRCADVRDERDWRNHLCLSEVWFITISMSTRMWRLLASTMSRSKSAMVPYLGSMAS